MDVIEVVASLLLMGACVGLTVYCVRRDPRWLGNAFLVPISALSVTGVSLSIGFVDPFGAALLLCAVLSPLLILALVIFLLWNGIDVLRREGVRLAHALPLLLAVGLIVVMVVCVASVLSRATWFFAVMLWVGLFCAWFGALLLGYIAYSVIYALIAARRRPDYVVTLGSGLIGDRVPPLLARRIDRAIELYRAGQRAGRAPLLVMSGGQGRDERVAEGQAMAAYAAAHGVRRSDLRVESASRSTEQNLRFSTEIALNDPRLGPDAHGVAVTSNYHALRAAVLARSLGLELDALGAPVAWYFWPSAMLREFVAIVRLHWRVVMLVGLLVSLPLPVFLAFAQAG